MNPNDFRCSPYGPVGGIDPSVPASAPMPIRPNVRAALDYLDNILSRGGEDAQDLWDILTAFRGPDEDRGSEHKDNVTVPIRRAALPLTRQAVAKTRKSMVTYVTSGPGVHQRASFGYDQSEYSYAGIRQVTGMSNHFNSHGFRAARALGLI